MIKTNRKTPKMKLSNKAVRNLSSRKNKPNPIIKKLNPKSSRINRLKIVSKRQISLINLIKTKIYYKKTKNNKLKPKRLK